MVVRWSGKERLRGLTNPAHGGRREGWNCTCRSAAGSKPVAILPRFLRPRFVLRELAKYGGRVIFATQEMSDDANGALMRNVLSAFDEYTSLETAKHVIRSMLQNARRGCQAALRLSHRDR
jgi:hypothetical protein